MIARARPTISSVDTVDEDGNNRDGIDVGR
jgi:hypothetical protein